MDEKDELARLEEEYQIARSRRLKAQAGVEDASILPKRMRAEREALLTLMHAQIKMLYALAQDLKMHFAQISPIDE